jgi:hypothetical protein
VSGLFYHDVLSALARADVPFVVVGGLAVNLQGVPRFTADVDIAIALDGSVLLKAARVLDGLGLRLRLPVPLEALGDTEQVRSWIADRNLSAITFADPAAPLREVDLVVASPVPFEELLRTSDRVTAAGLSFAVASVDALVRMKSGTGRAQDASDVEALLKIRGVRDAT